MGQLFSQAVIEQVGHLGVSGSVTHPPTPIPNRMHHFLICKKLKRK